MPIGISTLFIFYEPSVYIAIFSLFKNLIHLLQFVLVFSLLLVLFVVSKNIFIVEKYVYLTI